MLTLSACGSSTASAGISSHEALPLPQPAESLSKALATAAAGVHTPGAQASVLVCGQPYWAGSTGVTIKGTHDLVTNATRFVLASTTKTITATMIMSLVEKGRLSLQAPLSAFYPGLPDAKRITVQMLLNMTSGLPEYFDNPTIANIINNEPAHHWTRTELINALATMKPVFVPGTRYSYTDSNYVVLGGIIEKKTGMSIDAYFRNVIAGPAGMASSTFIYDPKNSGLFAHPYDEAQNGTLFDQFVPGIGIAADFWGEVWTDGGLASTASDLSRFGSALFAGKLVGKATLATMTVMGRYDYGLGVFDENIDGHRWLGHNGAYSGFESEDWTDPQRMVTIAVTTNVMEPDNANYAASDVVLQALVKAYDKLQPVGTCT